jgi:hypothetical protein
MPTDGTLQWGTSWLDVEPGVKTTPVRGVRKRMVNGPNLPCYTNGGAAGVKTCASAFYGP